MNTHTTRLFSYLQSASIYHRVSKCLQVTYYFGNKTWVKWAKYITPAPTWFFKILPNEQFFFSLVHKYVRMNVLLVIQKRILCTSRGNNPVVVMKLLHTHSNYQGITAIVVPLLNMMSMNDDFTPTEPKRKYSIFEFTFI